MSLGTIEHVEMGATLEDAIGAAFERLRSAGTSQCALVFDVEWPPTMDLVDLVARHLADSDDIETLTLVHPSAAMGFVASAVGLRVGSVDVRAQRSVYDEPDEDDFTDATASRTVFVMGPEERLGAFVGRAVGEARARAVKRFALVFDPKVPASMELSDVLVEELMQSGVREVGLVHPAASLETVVAALRLRLPNVRVAFATRTNPGAKANSPNEGKG